MSEDKWGEVARELNLKWGDNGKRGSLNTEWHAPCGCGYHPEPYPHVHPCSDTHDRNAQALRDAVEGLEKENKILQERTADYPRMSARTKEYDHALETVKIANARITALEAELKEAREKWKEWYDLATELKQWSNADASPNQCKKHPDTLMYNHCYACRKAIEAQLKTLQEENERLKDDKEYRKLIAEYPSHHKKMGGLKVLYESNGRMKHRIRDLEAQVKEFENVRK